MSIPKWTIEPPIEEGWYWFYGDPFMGQMGQEQASQGLTAPEKTQLTKRIKISG
ncbi:MAG: hypothetical protein ACXAEN_24770 [Candidatus Thorarchaeota archaeon]